MIGLPPRPADRRLAEDLGHVLSRVGNAHCLKAWRDLHKQLGIAPTEEQLLERSNELRAAAGVEPWEASYLTAYLDDLMQWAKIVGCCPPERRRYGAR
ncbi:MAG: hypothetical protein L0Y58_05715 [Verrucomicrobia subdivision 3 bacterium]|nr:hypothetical protein [Limisphaerales bacterium]